MCKYLGRELSAMPDLFINFHQFSLYTLYYYYCLPDYEYDLDYLYALLSHPQKTINNEFIFNKISNGSFWLHRFKVDG